MKDGSYGHSDHTSGTGHSGAGGAGGGDHGGNYTFRSYKSNPNISGNWNTGGEITGRGSFSRGIQRAPHISLPRATPLPTGFNVPPPPVPPLPITPVVSPISPPPAYPQPGTVTDVFSQPVRMDPGIIGQMLKGFNRSQAQPSTFNARPGAGGIGFPGMQKDQSRLGGGHVGGGFGGGGGGGW